MNRKMPESVKRMFRLRRSMDRAIKGTSKALRSGFKEGGYVLPKPHIKLQHYPKSKRSYWRVSPVPVKWRDLSTSQRAQWDAAHKFKERLNSQRKVCECCGQELQR